MVHVRSLLLSAFLALPVHATCTAAGLFTDGPTHEPVGTGSNYGSGSATADLNHDGKPDLIAATGDPDLSVFLNKGNLTFDRIPAPTGLSDANHLAIADMNGDGIADIVTIGTLSKSVAVLLGTGDGHFTALPPVSLDNAPNDIAIDRQGMVYVAAGSGIAILAGDGQGHLAVLTTIQGDSARHFGAYLAVSDFDNDGKTDIIANAYTLSGNTITATQAVYLRGLGNATFANPVTLLSRATANPYAPAVADLNGDGRPDLVIADEPNNVIQVFLNQNGTFAVPKSYDALLRPNKFGGPRSVAFADLDRDGKLDVMEMNLNGGFVGTFRGNGDGTLTPMSWILMTRYGPNAPSVADFDGDGRVDVVIVSPTGGFEILKNNCGSTSLSLSASATTVTTSQSVTLTATHRPDASFNGDWLGPTRPLPSGSIVFRDGASVINTVPLSSANLQTAFQSSVTGDHTLTATYTGDSNYDPTTSAPVVVKVTSAPLAASTTTVTSDRNPIAYGDTVTFRAIVSATDATPLDGTVTWFVDGVSVASVTLLPPAAATFSPKLSAGVHTINATYSGNATHLSSTSANLMESVSKASSSVFISLAGSSGVSVIIFPAEPVSGTLTLNEGSTAIATATIANTYTYVFTPVLTSGSHTLTVTYSGDANFNGSTSAPLTITVPPTPARHHAARH